MTNQDQMTLKVVDGWWCPCVGPDAGMWHHSAECPRRIRIRTMVPTWPAWRPPRAKWLDEVGVQHDVVESQLAPIVRCRELHGDDPIPPTAGRLLARVHAIDPGARLTYAKGWGRHLQVIGRKPEEEGGGEIKGYRPWPVESVVLRARMLALAWTRKEGDRGWSGAGGYAVRGGRIWPVTPAQASAFVKTLESGSEERAS